jgi:hypothetical protein
VQRRRARSRPAQRLLRRSPSACGAVRPAQRRSAERSFLASVCGHACGPQRLRASARCRRRWEWLRRQTSSSLPFRAWSAPHLLDAAQLGQKNSGLDPPLAGTARGAAASAGRVGNAFTAGDWRTVVGVPRRSEPRIARPGLLRVGVRRWRTSSAGARLLVVRCEPPRRLGGDGRIRAQSGTQRSSTARANCRRLASWWGSRGTGRRGRHLQCVAPWAGAGGSGRSRCPRL